LGADEFPEENFVGIRGGRIDHAVRNYYKVVKMSAIPKYAVYLDSDVNVLMTRITLITLAT
jgi:thiamine pyrophosphokinase